MTVRFFMMQCHYRSTLDFSNDALVGAEKGFKRVLAAIATLNDIKASAVSTVDVKDLVDRAYAAMNDDFNTPMVVAVLFDAVKEINLLKAGTKTATAADIESLKKFFNDFLVDIMGIHFEETTSSNDISSSLMQVILALRKDAKENKNYAMSDKIRDELKALNITIKDTKEGTEWTYEG